LGLGYGPKMYLPMCSFGKYEVRLSDLKTKMYRHCLAVSYGWGEGRDGWSYGKATAEICGWIPHHKKGAEILVVISVWKSEFLAILPNIQFLPGLIQNTVISGSPQQVADRQKCSCVVLIDDLHTSLWAIAGSICASLLAYVRGWSVPHQKGSVVQEGTAHHH